MNIQQERQRNKQDGETNELTNKPKRVNWRKKQTSGHTAPYFLSLKRHAQRERLLITTK